MSGGVIDGDRWRRARIAALRAALEADLDDDQRDEVRGELAALETADRTRRRRSWRWALWGSRPA